MNCQLSKFYHLFGLAALALLFSNCAAPFKVHSPYSEYEKNIQTIALYPLYFSEDGKEERLFGLTFSSMFFDAVSTMQYHKPIQFLMPDSTVSILRDSGFQVVSYKKGIVDNSDLFTEYPVYKILNNDELNAMSAKADALLFCELLNYNEVGAEEELAQALGTACLTMGMVTASEQNAINMRVSLFATRSGELLWLYYPWFSGSLSGREKTRNNFTNKILNGFQKYFPLSANFKKK